MVLLLILVFLSDVDVIPAGSRIMSDLLLDRVSEDWTDTTPAVDVDLDLDLDLELDLTWDLDLTWSRATI